MIKKIAAFMKRFDMVQKGDHISVALSGGADSVCLLLVLERLRYEMDFTISAIHIEHGIRGEESLSDMRFAQELAKRYDIPYSVKRVPTPETAEKQRISLEEAGRNLRYQAFEEERIRLGGKQVKTAVAHHGDDNAETLLFHLCRGSGIDGLAGIRPVRGALIRPLLCVTRYEIEQFLKEAGQGYRIDSTNTDVHSSRNRIRNRVMPQLSRVNQNCVVHMGSLSEDVQEICAYLQQETDKILQAGMELPGDGSICFRAQELAPYPPFLQKRALLELAAKAAGSRKDISREHLEALFLLAHGPTGKRISLPYGVLAENSYGMLLFSKGGAGDDGTVPARIPFGVSQTPTAVFGGTVIGRIIEITQKDVKIPKNLYTKWFDYDKIKNRLYIRNREPGDYFILDSQGRRQKLKDYWINEKVPKHMRARIPLLAEGSHILWAIGYRISAYYKITGDTKRVLEVQFMEEES